MPPRDRQKLQPRSMQANINRFNTQMRRDPDSAYRTRSPAGNQYDQRRFNIMDQNQYSGNRYTGGSDREEEVRSMLFKNTYRTNPTTGNKFGNSMSIFQGPDREWVESRYIYPDASGFGQRWDDKGRLTEYPIQLKGPQTWNYDPGTSNYDPGNQGIMGLEMADATDYMNKMKEGYQKIDPYLPDVDWQDKSIGHEWNTPLWGGTLGIGGEYDFDDDQYKAGINWTIG